jgi:glycolate oxidase
MMAYSHDETEDLHYSPEVVLKPGTSMEIASIVKYCNAHNFPVTPMGARTGLSGGALALFGGVALSTERLNKIINIDCDNLQATVEPAVITQVFQEAVMEKDLFYPPDPASRGSCFIGGNLSENSGGPKAVKYGVTKDYVLNLEVVLPSGDIIWTGANVLKNATGYNLTQLLVGSEGTLGIITKAVFRLIPLPTRDVMLLVPFKSAMQACEAVAEIFKAGITPSVMEFMEIDALRYVSEFIDSPMEIEDGIEAHLLIEVDGNEEDLLMKEAETILSVVEKFDISEVLFADSQAQKDRLWEMRRKVGEAVKSQSIYKEEDTVVPRFHLVDLLKGVKEIGNKYGFKSVCYGHAGDGNLHVNILKGDLNETIWNEELPIWIEEIFELTVGLGGTISGEHGIGLVQKRYMPIAFSSVQLDLMKAIKKVFDPNGIMNPGKIFE